jgi:hypothetical protein
MAAKAPTTHLHKSLISDDFKNIFAVASSQNKTVLRNWQCLT